MAADRAPGDFVRAARTVTSRRHPVADALVGFVIGGAIAWLFRFASWWSAALLLVVIACALWGYCSWTFAPWAARRAFRRRISAAGWCWFCHGRHAVRCCPDRSTR